MTPADAIRLHNAAWESRDAAALLDALAPGALYEMPLLRSRMVGRAEIAAGLEIGFGATERCAVEVTAVREAGDTAIAEAVLRPALTREGTTPEIPCAIVAEVAGDAIARISVYLDARPFRLWADGPVMAMTRGAAR